MRFPKPSGTERKLVEYSFGNFGKHLVLSGVDVTLLFLLIDLLHISPASVTILMIAVFIGDLVFGLGAGAAVSWAQTRGVGYRTMILTGTIPCAASFALLYSLPLVDVERFAVLAAILLVFRGAYAVVDVLHSALMAKVAPDSHARGRTSGYRYFFSTLAGIIIALILAPAVERAAHLDMTAELAGIGIVTALVFCMTMLVVASSASSEMGVEQHPHASPLAMLFPKPDRLFACIAAISVVNGLAISLFTKMVLHLATYVFDDPRLAGTILLATTLGQVPGVIFWMYLVRFADKTVLMTASYGVAAIGFILFAMAGSEPALLLATATLIGFGLGGVFMLPWGIYADAIDFAEFRHGERREAATFASILVILKISKAAGFALASWTLGELGYTPGIQQSASVDAAIKFLALGIPVIGCIAAVFTLLPLSIGHQRHARVLRALAMRNFRNSDQIVPNSSRQMADVSSDIVIKPAILAVRREINDQAAANPLFSR